MRRILKITGIIILVATAASFAPVVGLYLEKDPVPYTNAQAITKLADNSGDKFRFLVFSDSHSGLILSDSAALKAVRNMKRENRFHSKTPVDFVISAGDITFRGSKWDFANFNKLRSRMDQPLICAAGNHDDDVKAVRDLFKKYCGANEFSFTNRNSYFIVLDNSINAINDRQFEWLESELMKSAPYTHRFIIMHKPSFSPYQQAWYRPELSSWPYKFMKMCEKYKVDIVFTGHEHMFRDVTYNGVRYITTGGVGMPMDIPTADGGYHHYLSVRVLGDHVDIETRKIFPPLWEYLCYYMWKDLLFALKSVFF